MSARVVVPRVTFPALLERLYAAQHTGPVVVHFAQGRPQVIEIPAAPERIALDNRRGSGADLTRTVMLA